MSTDAQIFSAFAIAVLNESSPEFIYAMVRRDPVVASGENALAKSLQRTSNTATHAAPL